MQNDPRKHRTFPDYEDDEDGLVTDEQAERNQSVEELGSQENQPDEEEDYADYDSPDTPQDLVPLWNLL